VKATDEIENAKELAVEHGLFDDDLELISIPEAAPIIGVSEAFVWNMIKDNEIPSEKHGKRRYMRKSVCEIIAELREKHGRNWKCEFQRAMLNIRITADAVGDDETVHNEESEDTVDPTLKRLRDRAEECRQEGRFEASSEMFALLVDILEEP
jgi:predicted DNA-binding transcriptional regulator AlpA